MNKLYRFLSNKSKLTLVLSFVSIFIILPSCGIWDPADARKISPNVDDRQRKAVEEGRGFTADNVLLGKKSGTNFEFSSSNALWRATLEVLDFIPLSNVDYSGGIIITDWYNEGTTGDESIKITVRFLSNEIRADGILIIIHKKKCNKSQSCTIKKIQSNLEQEVKLAILKKATILDREKWEKRSEDYKKRKGKSLL